ncbi:ABC transporter substrate-binding protein [Andreprevotia sp. IGB-42]|uniref:substrate-binding periplasmic protein n=1 Tax=Andreprevotia sp. IGB-42 TaxID=2497473 RepID=UPI001359872A|nr:transporter substrate-binding domain-containing protein [Andreprevotia sp. IGB-42]
MVRTSAGHSSASRWQRGLAVLLCAAVLPVQAASPVALMSFPGFTNEDGTGFYPDLVRALYGDEVDVKESLFPPSRALWMFDTHQTDVLFAIPVCRWKDAHFLSIGLHDYEVFVGPVGQPLPKPGDSLAGKSIAVVQGLTHTLRKRHPEWQWYDTLNYQQAMRMLMVGRVDYVYGYAFLMDQTINQLKLGKTLRYDLGKVFDQTIPALALHADARGVAEARKLEGRLKAMIASGGYRKLMQSYNYPLWYYQDGLAGQITLTRQADCPQQD